MHLRRAWHSIDSPSSRPNRARPLRPRAALPFGNMAAECASAAGPAVAAVAQAGYSLFLMALKEGAGGPGGCFLSPLSIVYALSLAINGAGGCATCTVRTLHEAAEASGDRHGGHLPGSCKRQMSAHPLRHPHLSKLSVPDPRLTKTVPCCPARATGPGSATHSELLKAVQGPGTVSEAELNSALQTASTSLTAASGDNGTSMVLANSLWTHKGLQLKPEYVKAMAELFKVFAERQQSEM
jgi:hypothetical protein